MPPSRPAIPPAPQPTREIFDPFNSCSTGHQRAENRVPSSTSWRVTRTNKLAHQLRDTSGGGGSESFGLDGRRQNGNWEKAATPGLREDGWRDIRDMMQGPRKRGSAGDGTGAWANKKAKMERDDGESHVTGDELQGWDGRLSTDKTTANDNPHLRKTTEVPDSTAVAEPAEPNAPDPATSRSPPPTLPQIFRGLNVYLNGPTLPHISDHMLKRLLVQHGANISIALGRRTVTHVILGDKGGLATGKIQKEVAKTGGKGIKFVGVRWVLDSIEKGKRQPESRYEVVRLAMKGQRSVLGMGMARSDKKDDAVMP